MRKIKQRKATILALSNGLRIVHSLTPGSSVGLFGLMARAGSAKDPENKPGLAHFVEHTLFKGTKKRSAWHILNRMEAVGGELNAYTSKEEMVVYSLFPAGNEKRAVELIADLVENSTFAEKELATEKDVVIEEISAFLDTPSERVYDDFEDRLFAGTPLGHNILGSEEYVKAFSSEDCIRFLVKNFGDASELVAFYSGPVSESRIKSLMESHFASIDNELAKKDQADKEKIQRPSQFNIKAGHPGHQANVVMGNVVEISSPEESVAMALLVNILGGPGMNSRLNVALREKRGMVYSVEATYNKLPQTAWVTIFFACDAEDVAECEKIIKTIIAERAAEPISEKALLAAKKQFEGQLAISWENRETEVTTIAKTLLFYGVSEGLSEQLVLVRKLTSEDLLAAARKLTELSVYRLLPG